jgi:ring-1,2-phenylacetyl-CoA epoxidase subunit PaaC
VAAKGVKELAYHRDHAAQWTLRLAGGTAYSRARMIAGFDRIWPLVDELFTPHEVETRLPDVAVDPATVRPEVEAVLAQVFEAAALEPPTAAPMSTVAGRAGRDGVHTEAMGYLLAEMQHLARSLPGAKW